MQRITIFVFTLVLMAALSPVSVFGCACCAERGFHHRSSENLDEYMQKEIKKLSFGSAILYTDAGYPDTITGINPLGESFSVSSAAKSGLWNPSFADDKNRAGALKLAAPVKLETFMTDRDPLSESYSVTLYKEIRFTNPVLSGSGFLKDGIDKKTRYELILQGTGNLCHNNSDYKTYVLKIKGANADFSYFGKLAFGEDTVMQHHVDSMGNKPADIPTPGR